VDDIQDQDLIRAIRRRLLAEIEKAGQGAPVDRIVNNVYGSPGTHGGNDAGGIFGALGNAAPSENDPFEYYVDIARRNVTDPETDKVIGWDKNVKRYTKKKA
jgi:hypothetical protein